MEIISGFEKTINYSPDSGAGGGANSKDSEVSKKNQKIVDLNIVLAKVPSEVRASTDKYIEYRQKVDEAKLRLNEDGIDIDAYTKKDIKIGTEEGNKEYGQRKADLRAIIEKVIKRENLDDREREIMETTNIKLNYLSTEERQREDKEIKNPWDRAISIIEMQKDPVVRRNMRVAWVQNHLEDMEIPYYVIQEQSEKIDNDTGSNKSSEKKAETKKIEVFTEKEEGMIIKECYDLVFERGKNTTDDVKKSLFDISGIIASTLGRGKDPVISEELTKKIESLGIESWVNMRNVVGQWDNFKEVKEIDTYTLKLNMFMLPFSETFFAKAKCPIPFEDENGKFIGVKEVELEPEISKAMKEIRDHFANELKDDYGNPALVEYWKLLGDQAERVRLYRSLNLNKYIGETAYALLVSYQMLTDTSAEDFMSMMVDQADTRVKKYKISEERDPFVRMLIAFDLVKGKIPFTQSAAPDFYRNREETAKRLAALIPAKLISTGLTGDGMEHLNKGDWLKWRVDTNFYSKNDLDRAKIAYNKAKNSGNFSEDDLKELKAKIKPVTDQSARLDQMKSALTVLNLMKEIASDSSDSAKYESLKGRLYAHMTGSFGDNKWLGDGAMVPKEFSLNDVQYQEENENVVEAQDMPLNEWISRTMMGVGKVFLYTHSIIDDECTKPWEMKTFAENAANIFKMEVQSAKPTFVGQQKEKFEEHRKAMIRYIDKVWKLSYDFINILKKPWKSPKDYPNYYQRGVAASAAVFDVAKKADPQIGEWNRLSHPLR